MESVKRMGREVVGGANALEVLYMGMDIVWPHAKGRDIVQLGCMFRGGDAVLGHS
jgi:hypothetical protein